ncbi:MAG: hypothetical protein AB7P20_01665 [Rhizobiaceae bacterium]
MQGLTSASHGQSGPGLRIGFVDRRDVRFAVKPQQFGIVAGIPLEEFRTQSVAALRGDTVKREK